MSWSLLCDSRWPPESVCLPCFARKRAIACGFIYLPPAGLLCVSRLAHGLVAYWDPVISISSRRMFMISVLDFLFIVHGHFRIDSKPNTLIRCFSCFLFFFSSDFQLFVSWSWDSRRKRFLSHVYDAAHSMATPILCNSLNEHLVRQASAATSSCHPEMYSCTAAELCPLRSCVRNAASLLEDHSSSTVDPLWDCQVLRVEIHTNSFCVCRRPFKT